MVLILQKLFDNTGPLVLAFGGERTIVGAELLSAMSSIKISPLAYVAMLIQE